MSVSKDISIILEEAGEMKKEGNKVFIAGNYAAASKLYHKGLKLLMEWQAEGPVQEKERKKLIQDCELNVAACHMRVKKWQPAIDICDKVIVLNPSAMKAWYRRGDCYLHLLKFKSALSDFKQAQTLDPTYAQIQEKILDCQHESYREVWKHSDHLVQKILKEVEIRGEGYGDGVQPKVSIGGPIPNFVNQYKNKFQPSYYDQARIKQSAWDFEKYHSLNEAANLSYVPVLSSDPLAMQKRYGTYIAAAKMQGKNLKFGNVLEIPCELQVRTQYDQNMSYITSQNMKNTGFSSWIMKTGETHVALGCVDFSQLLFAEFVGDTNIGIHFHGVDSAVVSITRCKVLNEMVKNQASSRSILQVWFSSGWSELTLTEFMAACYSVLLTGNDINVHEKILIHDWMNNEASLQTAYDQWSQTSAKSGTCIFNPCVNFRRETDRVDYARYLLTGIIFEETEESLITANRTMFVSESKIRQHENFYRNIDTINSKENISSSLKTSTDAMMMKRMDQLKEMTKKGLLTMSFECARMCVENSHLIESIKKMNPRTLDWSNLSDYCSREEFLKMAKGVSGDMTAVHYMHSCNWSNRVPGSFIADYDKLDMRNVLRTSYKAWDAIHKKLLGSSAQYRSLWRDNSVFATCMNLTANIAAYVFKDAYLNYMFGDINHRFNVKVFSHICQNNQTIEGAFTFADQLPEEMTAMRGSSV